MEDGQTGNLGQVALKTSKGSLQKKKIAQNETFAYLGGRGVKKIPFIYIIKNGT